MEAFMFQVYMGKAPHFLCPFRNRSLMMHPWEIMERNKNAKNKKSIFELMDIDIQTGLSYCMNDIRFLTDMIFEYESEDMSEPLQQAFDEKDWENYKDFVRDNHSTWMGQYQHLLGEIMKIKKGSL